METNQLKEELTRVKRIKPEVAIQALVVIVVEILAKVDFLEERVEALEKGLEIENGWG